MDYGMPLAPLNQLKNEFFPTAPIGRHGPQRGHIEPS